MDYECRWCVEDIRFGREVFRRGVLVGRAWIEEACCVRKRIECLRGYTSEWTAAMGPGPPSASSMVVRTTAWAAAESSSTIRSPSVAAASFSATAVTISFAGAAFVVGGAGVGWAFSVVVGVVFLSVLGFLVLAFFSGLLVCRRRASMREIMSGTPWEAPAPWSWRWGSAVMMVFTLLAVGFVVWLVLGEEGVVLRALFEAGYPVPEWGGVVHVGD